MNTIKSIIKFICSALLGLILLVLSIVAVFLIWLFLPFVIAFCIFAVVVVAFCYAGYWIIDQLL